MEPHELPPTLTRRKWLQMAGLGAAAMLARPLASRAADAPPPAPRPNILYIFTDQQYADMMSCAGNPYLKTPAMDSLAAAGARFTRAYAANPVCSPARVGMMTGSMPSRIGMGQNEDMPQAKANVSEALLAHSLGRVFREGGYETAYGGKVHLPMTLEAIGFEAITKDDRAGLADACAAFLRKKHEKPFLLVASFINPHDICFMAIRAHARSLKPGEKADPNAAGGGPKLPTGPTGQAPPPDQCPPLPDNYEVPAGEPEGVRQVDPRAFRFYVRDHWTKDDWRVHRWAYCRLTERVDGEIGVVLAALREAGMEEKTVVVFSSDHGDMDSSHRLDLLPTLCDFAGIAAPKELAGRSVRPLAEGRAAPSWRDTLVVEGHRCRALHTERFKYTVYDIGEHREMLVDMEKDPGEMKNLVPDPACREALLDCRKRLGQWYRANGETLAPGYVVA